MLCRVSVAVAAVDSRSGGLAMVYFFSYFFFLSISSVCDSTWLFISIFLSIFSVFKYPEADL